MGVYHKILLKNCSDIIECWSNEFKMGTHDLALLSESARELEKIVNKASKYKTCWKIEHDNSRFTRLISEDCFGNTHYIVGYKF